MNRMMAVMLVLVALAGCDKKPVAGSAADVSAEGESIRRAVADVDAATAEAKAPPA